MSGKRLTFTIEELIRRFNEENNEEAGEHFTPRDVIRLMANLIFLPIPWPASAQGTGTSTTALLLP
jgi:alkylation response protein AidB-like acyl-CoA dehydrogenase